MSTFKKEKATRKARNELTE